MKQHLSVLMLFVRSSFLRVLVVCVLMTVAETGLFYHTQEKLLVQKEEGALRVLTVDIVAEEAKLLYVFLAAVLIVLFILLRGGIQGSSHQEYTLHRLRITPGNVYFWQAFYNSCCLILLWAVQAGLAFVLCSRFLQTADAGIVTGQSLFLAFYRSPFLNAVLPLEYVIGWVRNVLWFVGLGTLVAYESCLNCRKKHSILLLMVAVFGMRGFAGGLDDYVGYLLLCGFCVLTVAFAVWQMFGEKEWMTDEETAV